MTHLASYSPLKVGAIRDIDLPRNLTRLRGGRVMLMTRNSIANASLRGCDEAASLPEERSVTVLFVSLVGNFILPWKNYRPGIHGENGHMFICVFFEDFCADT